MRKDCKGSGSAGVKRTWPNAFQLLQKYVHRKRPLGCEIWSRWQESATFNLPPFWRLHQQRAGSSAATPNVQDLGLCMTFSWVNPEPNPVCTWKILGSPFLQYVGKSSQFLAPWRKESAAFCMDLYNLSCRCSLSLNSWVQRSYHPFAIDLRSKIPHRSQSACSWQNALTSHNFRWQILSLNKGIVQT